MYVAGNSSAAAAHAFFWPPVMSPEELWQQRKEMYTCISKIEASQCMTSSFLLLDNRYGLDDAWLVASPANAAFSDCLIDLGSREGDAANRSGFVCEQPHEKSEARFPTT
eukprot:scaffold294709_cov17-Prasinocladus_malaysianus.AAC.1